jgi:hypothetical protein
MFHRNGSKGLFASKITNRFCIIYVFFTNFEVKFPVDQIIHC